MRRMKNEIKGVEIEGSEWIEDEKKVENSFVSYFDEIFSSSVPSQEDMDKILQTVACKV